MVRTEAHTVFAQNRARGLFQPLDLFRDPMTVKHAQRFRKLECQAAGDADNVFGGRKAEQRLQQPLDMRPQP